jgi:hypothetical protein
MQLLVDWLRQISVSLLLLWGVGVAVLVLLVPKSYRREVLLIAPFFGLGLISGICHYLGALGLSVEQFGWAFILLSGVALAAVIARRRNGLNLWYHLRHHLGHHWGIIALCLATYIIAMLPLIRLGYLTTVGTTIDGLSYAVRSEYLQEAGLVRPDVPAGRPFYGWVAAQIDLLRVGDVYFVALVGALSAVRSFQLLTTTAALFFALAPASVYVLSRRTFRLKEPAALLAAGLVGIHNLLLWSVYDNFLSQTIALSLFPLLLSFEIEAVRTLRLPETVGFAVLFTALISVYPVYALPVVAIGVLYEAVEGVRSVQHGQQRALPTVIRYLVWMAGVLVLLLVCNGVAVRRAFNELGFIGRLLDPEQAWTLGQGNIVVFPPVSEVAGLIAHTSSAYGLGAWQLPVAALAVLNVIVAALIGIGWRRLPAEARSAPAIALAVTLGLALQQRFGVNPPHGYPYGYFKAVSLVALSISPLLAQGFFAILGVPRFRCFAWPLLVGIIGLNAVNTLWMIDYVLEDRIVVTQEVIEVVPGLRDLTSDEWILLDLQPGITQHWIGYLLKDHRVHYREPLFTQHVYDHVYPPPTYQYALIERRVDALRAEQRVLDEPWYNPQMHEVVWSDGVYDLRRRVDAVLTDLKPSVSQRYWDAGESLQIAVDAADGLLEARLGTDQVLEGDMFGRPQTLQVTLLVLTDTAEIYLTEIPVELSPGVWLADIALGDSDSVLLENTGIAPVLLHRIKSLGVDTGDPDQFLELERRPEGVAFVTQSIGETGLEYEATLVRPADDGSFVYRLGVHIFDPVTSRHFGVWGLDFSGPERLQQGALRINLATQAAQGTVESVQVPVDMGHHEVESGSFEIQLVWWRLGSPSHLSLYPSAHFTRDTEGRVQLEEASEIPVTILAPPW